MADSGRRRRAPGVLLVHHRPTREQFADAANVAENIAAFGRDSRFPVWGYNTDLPMLGKVTKFDFDAILLHYSVFVPADTETGYLIPPGLADYLRGSSAYKVATFQDEYHHCRRRFGFIDEYGIDCVYTMLAPPHDAEVYLRNTSATRVVSNLPAYVGRELIDVAMRFARPYAERTLDLGYRGRPMPAYMGRGAQEKREIGERFAELAAGSGISMDIGVREEDRIYGEDWNRFVATLRGTLGVESGVSCFDLRDEVREEFERLAAERGREPTLNEMETGSLGEWDWKIPYVTLSPRNLEAAAFRVTQILFEGSYSGAMEPMRHYIPLRKDFSNLDEVIERFRDEGIRRDLAENAHADMIESGELGYEKLVRGFDEVLADAGLASRRADPKALVASTRLRPPQPIPRRERRALAEQRFRESHPKVWNAIWTVSRPVAVPVRFVLSWLRRG